MFISFYLSEQAQAGKHKFHVENDRSSFPVHSKIKVFTLQFQKRKKLVVEWIEMWVKKIATYLFIPVLLCIGICKIYVNLKMTQSLRGGPKILTTNWVI